MEETQQECQFKAILLNNGQIKCVRMEYFTILHH